MIRCVLVASLSIVSLSLNIAPLRADTSTPIVIGKIEVGFADKYKVGYWTPVRVRLFPIGDSQNVKLAENAHIEIVVPDGDGVPCRFRSSQPFTKVQFTNIDSIECELLVKFGRIKSAVQVSLVGDDDQRTILAERQFFDEVPAAMVSTRELIVCVGTPPAIEAANRLQRQTSLEQTEVALIADAQSLPRDSLAYDGVDWLIASTSEPAKNLNAAVCQAIDDWIMIGGRLLLLADSQAEAMSKAGPDSLGRFLPGKFHKFVPLSRLPGIVTYSETSEAIEAEPGNSRLQIKVPQLTELRGRVDAYEGHDARELPLVVRTPRGFGLVVWCGLDLDRPPLAKWPGQKQLLQKLLGRPAQGSDDKNDDVFSQTGSSTGYLDLSGQLRSALEQFERVQFIPFWQVGTFAAVYLLLLGPIDYLLLKKLGRPELTWITFPILAAIFCYGAYHYAQVSKGDRTQINQVDLVDFDADDHLIRGHSWITMFSPESRTDNIELRAAVSTTGHRTKAQSLGGDDRPQKPPADGQLSWLGLPGVGIGGMDSAAASPALFIEPYDVHPHRMQIDNVPLAIWSTKGFEASYRMPSADSADRIELTETASHQLRGTLVNPLHVELTDAVLYFDRWSYALGKLPADFSERIEDRFHALSVDAAITHRKMSGDKDLTTPYDRSDANPARILELMMFHEAAGGRKYTRLLDRYNHTLDLSAQLRLGQAILVGIGPARTELKLNSQPVAEELRGQRLTVYRYMFPVKLQEEK